jgi:hypothetical protein
MPGTADHIQNVIHSFLQQLKREEFAIGTDSYIHTTDVVNWFLKEKMGEQPEALQYYLSPLLCKTDEEQIKFGKLFTQYFLVPFKQLINPVTPAPTRSKPWIWVLLAIAVVAIGFYIYQYKTYKPGIDYSLLLNDTLFVHQQKSQLIEAGKVFKNKKDTQYFTITNTFTDGVALQGASVNYSFKKYGVDSFKIHYKSERFEIDTTITHRFVYVGPPERNLIIPQQETVVAGDSGVYLTEADTSLIKNYYWVVDSVPVTTQEPRLAYRFTTEGEHRIEFFYDTVNNPHLQLFPASFTQAVYIQKVVPPAIQLSTEHHAPPPVVKNKIKRNWLYASLVIAALSILLGLWRFIKPKKPVVLAVCEDEVFTGDKPPYNIPFTGKEQRITNVYALQRLSNDLKKRIDTQASVINISKTINESIRNRGFLTPQYSQKQVLREYLFLIDQAFINSQQLQLFTYLVRYFVTRSVRIDFYYYHQYPNLFYKDAEGSRYTPAQLKDMHYSATLLLITEGSSLVQWQKPLVKEEMITMLGFWQNRLLLTPVPVNDWSSNEKALAAFFKLLPADVEGLLELVRFIEEDDALLLKRTQQQLLTYAAKHEDIHTADGLRTYLKDEELFQWLCAAAVLPKLYWAYLLEAGKTILSDPSAITYETLLKLVRIDWVHRGSIPPALRLELLKQLTVENELKARNTLMHMLDEAEVDEEAFSFEEQQALRYASGFVLAASGKEAYSSNKQFQSFEERFICLYKKEKISDAPFKIYIEKKDTANGNWSTPVETQGGNTGIEAYISAKEDAALDIEKTKQRRQNTFNSFLVSLGVLLLIFVYHLSSKKDKIVAENNLSKVFIQTDSLRNDSLFIKIDTQCVKTILQAVNEQTVLLEINNANVNRALPLDSAVFISILSNQNATVWPVPGKTSTITLTAGTEKQTADVMLKPGTLVLKFTGNCPVENRLLIQFYPGYKDDTAVVNSRLRNSGYLIETVTSSQGAMHANAISFGNSVDSSVMYQVCKEVLKAGIELKTIRKGTTGSSTALVKSRENYILLYGEKELEYQRPVTADSIDCLFRKINCIVPVPIPSKPAVAIYYNNNLLRTVAAQAGNCIKNRGFEIAQQRLQTTATGNVILYYRSSFADSATALQLCLKNNSGTEFVIRRANKPLPGNIAAQVLMEYKVPQQANVSIEISDESLRPSAEAFSKELAANGITVSDIRTGKRGSNSIIIYSDAKVKSEATQIQTLYRKYYPDLPIETELIQGRSEDMVVIWLQKKQDLQPQYVFSNIKYQNQITQGESLEINFTATLSGVPPSPTQTIPSVEGEICVEGTSKACASFMLTDANGSQPVTQKVDVSNLPPGNYNVFIKLPSKQIQKLVPQGFVIKQKGDNAVAPRVVCDTIERSFDVSRADEDSDFKSYNLTFTPLKLSLPGTKMVFKISKDDCSGDIYSRTLTTRQSTTFKFCDNTTVVVQLINWSPKVLKTVIREANVRFIICRPYAPSAK